MITVEQLDEEIKKLEQLNATYTICEKLAALYTVRDHIVKTPVLDNSSISIKAL